MVTSVVQNLIGNAIKYMDADRPVRVVTARARAAGRMVRLEVEDTGPGIAPGIQQMIFEPFVRGRHADVGGIGLGLATVKRLAEAHGGAAGVRPGQQNGAVFWIDLPAASGAAQRERPEKIGAGTGA